MLAASHEVEHPLQDGALDPLLPHFVEKHPEIKAVKGLGIVQEDYVKVLPILQGSYDHIVMVHELRDTGAPPPEAMLAMVEEGVGFKKLNDLCSDNLLKDFAKIGGKGDWSEAGWLGSIASRFEDWDDMAVLKRGWNL